MGEVIAWIRPPDMPKELRHVVNNPIEQVEHRSLPSYGDTIIIYPNKKDPRRGLSLPHEFILLVLR